MAIANTKQLIDFISGELFKAEDRRLAGVVNDLSRSNRETLGTHCFNFMYGGKVYMPTNAPTISTGPGSSVGLAFSLTNQMEAFLKDKANIDRDRKLIEQMIFKLIYQCCNEQEVRDALPDCLVSVVPSLSKLPRKLDQKFIIRHDERTLRQFEAILPKMEFYSVMRLMY